MTEQNRMYRRAAFSTRLPCDRLFTAGHAWLLNTEGDTWRVGLTKFATRLLGEPVEYDMEVSPDTPVAIGQVIGWVEGLKAVTDLYCPMAATFGRSNGELAADMTLLQSDPYGSGWLYDLVGTPGDDCYDVDGYTGVLDANIDKMTGNTA